MATETDDLDLMTPEAETEELDCSMVVPMVEYVEAMADDPEACVPCGLAVVVPWYRDELAESHPELSAEIAGIDPDKDTNLDVAETLDRVRAAVGGDEATAERLDNFACQMQTFVNEEATKAGEDGPAVGLDTDAEDVPE